MVRPFHGDATCASRQRQRFDQREFVEFNTDIWAGLLATGSYYWPRLPKHDCSVASAVFVPGYSGGTATDSHRLPYSSVNDSFTDTHVVVASYLAIIDLQMMNPDLTDELRPQSSRPHFSSDVPLNQGSLLCVGFPVSLANQRHRHEQVMSDDRHSAARNF